MGLILQELLTNHTNVMLERPVTSYLPDMVSRMNHLRKLEWPQTTSSSQREIPEMCIGLIMTLLWSELELATWKYGGLW